MAFLRKIHYSGGDYVPPEVAYSELPSRKCENWRTFGERATCRSKDAARGRDLIAPPVKRGPQFSDPPRVRKTRKPRKP